MILTTLSPISPLTTPGMDEDLSVISVMENLKHWEPSINTLRAPNTWKNPTYVVDTAVEIVLVRLAASCNISRARSVMHGSPVSSRIRSTLYYNNLSKD